MTAVSTPVLTGGEAVVRALRAHGVELVFGIPGTHTLPIHRHLTAATSPRTGSATSRRATSRAEATPPTATRGSPAVLASCWRRAALA